MREALNAAMCIFLMDIPWFVLCCVPFMPMRKIERKTMAWRIFLVSLACFLIVFSVTLLKEGNPLQLLNQVRIVMHGLMILVFFRSFDVGWWKILYIFFFEQGVASEVNLLAYLSTTQVFHQDSSLTESLWLPLNVWLILLLVYPVLWWFFRGPMRQAMQLLSETQIRSLCSVPFFFCILCTLYGIYSKSIGFTAFHNALFSLFFSLVGVAAYVVTLSTTVNIVKSTRLELSMMEMEQQLERQSQRFDQLKLSIEQARSSRHDLRHHIAVIERYTEDGDLKGLQAYLKEYLSYLPKENEQPYCQNFAIDVLAHNYLSQAKEAGAELDIKIGLPQRLTIPDSQLCIVFGNIFENALNACKRQKTGKRFIRVRCVTEDNQLVLAVDNSTEPLQRIEAGIGLSSVKAVVEKYNGTLEYQERDGIFQTSVMMFIP
ncbi:sensor histidine kinase [Enterococcus sp. DIV0756]|uniref:sensor histidine kinase n=1 Tax=Enterococcus sp. DIV0756 TaxID=2774636 RepID=UPI003F2857D1